MKKTLFILAALLCGFALKDIAMQKPNTALPIYNAGRAEALGGTATPCDDCPAVEVSKGTTTIRLYSPDKVEFIKVEE